MSLSAGTSSLILGVDLANALFRYLIIITLQCATDFRLVGIHK